MSVDLKQLLKQAQQMQSQMETAKKQLAQTLVTGEAGGGLVKATLDGSFEAKKTEIDPSLMSGDKEVLEDLITAAWNAAKKKIDAATKSEMGKLSDMINLPPGFKSPFEDDK
ncbi:MAG: YbaB/EbfC family nucleoid-associated protein [Gammaproteobacteria bacterium]